MKTNLPSRLCLGAAFALLLAGGPAFARGLGQKAPPQPAIRQERAAQRAEARAAPPQRDGHLPRWIENHKNLSPADQQHALESEPGFRELPAQTQQNMRDRLTQLNNMDPQQRARILDRNEALERLSPPERQQYRTAVQGFATMPPERRRPMARAILDLREMPPDQRDKVINSPAFSAQFNDSERSTIRTLLTAEPYTGDH